MKMKEVCDKTDLTERAVRFYVAKGLVSPELIVRNDREYREYSREDVQTLRDISDLRKLSFSIEEILSMQKSPERIAEVLSVRRAALRKEINITFVPAQVPHAAVHAREGIKRECRENRQQFPLL